jgi:thymidylate kinase
MGAVVDVATDSGSDPFARALRALDAAGVSTRLRKPPEAGPAPEIDLWIDRPRLQRARSALAEVGFHPFRARGQGSHRFYLGFQGGRWLKIDAKIRAEGIGLGLGRWADAAARRWPLGLRRLGPLVAIVGPDGAGKGTVIDGLHGRIPVAVRSVYLGGGASGKRSRGRAQPSEDRSAGAPDRPAGPAREGAFLVARFVRAWGRLARGYAAAWRGAIVLCDRHPLEVLAVDPDRTPVGRRLERFLAIRLTPRPDAVVVLDAPARTLFDRKPEHPVERLERWRRSYAGVFEPMGARVVSTAGTPDLAIDAVSEIVWGALRARRRW